MRERIKEGYKLIAEYRSSLAKAEKAPMYYAGGYDNEGEPEDIVENLGPWDAVQSSAEALAGNKAATRLLKVCKVTVEQTEFGVFVRNEDGKQISSREIPVFKRAERKGR